MIFIDSAGCSPVTLVVTSNTLFLAKENFAHWPLPRMQKLPPLESLLPPFLDVEQRDITDVEKIVGSISLFTLLVEDT